MYYRFLQLARGAFLVAAIQVCPTPPTSQLQAVQQWHVEQQLWLHAESANIQALLSEHSSHIRQLPEFLQLTGAGLVDVDDCCLVLPLVLQRGSGHDLADLIVLLAPAAALRCGVTTAGVKHWHLYPPLTHASEHEDDVALLNVLTILFCGHGRSSVCWWGHMARLGVIGLWFVLL